MLDSIVTKLSLPPFSLHTREEQGDGGASPTLLIYFLIHPESEKKSFANGGHSFKTFLEKTLLSLTSVEVQWQR